VVTGTYVEVLLTEAELAMYEAMGLLVGLAVYPVPVERWTVVVPPVADALAEEEPLNPVMWNGKLNWKIGLGSVLVESRVILNP